MVIALLGRAGHGKSTVARYLQDTRGWIPVSLAGPLKRVAQTVMGFTDAQLYGSQADKERIDPRYGFSAREFLQRLGTDGLRREFGADVHVRALMHSLDPGKTYVVDDARFADEVLAVRDAGGRVYKVICADLPRPTAEHESESAIDEIPHSMLNGVIISARTMGTRHLFREVDAIIP
jgi:hypothetical protein